MPEKKKPDPQHPSMLLLSKLWSALSDLQFIRFCLPRPGEARELEEAIRAVRRVESRIERRIDAEIAAKS